MNIGETDVPSSKPVSECFVIYSKEVEESGVEIMHLQSSRDCFIAPLIRFSIGDARSYASSSHPEAEAVFVVISARPSLRERRPSKFAGPEDEGLIQHSPAP